VLASGLGGPLAAQLPLAPAEKILAPVALSLLGVWLFAWAVNVWALPLAARWILPALDVARLDGRNDWLAAAAPTGAGRESGTPP
jgi:hypothetical protein